MNKLQLHVKEVISALQCHVDRIVKIENLIGSKEDFTRDEKETLKGLVSSLRQDLKNAANRQTVQNNKKEPTEIEANYFTNATRDAERRLLMINVGTHPFRANWCSRLDDARSDIQIYIRSLEDQYLKNI